MKIMARMMMMMKKMNMMMVKMSMVMMMVKMSMEMIMVKKRKVSRITRENLIKRDKIN
jgi:hypothetical protein